MGDNAVFHLMYEHALLPSSPFHLPDIGIDDSILKYSGTDSNSQLTAYSNELLTKLPNYIEKIGTSLAGLGSVPNAVGLGALVIYMILDISMESTTETDQTYSMLRRVFGEEKASSVHDTMSEYVKRHQTFINNRQQLREEIRRLEAQLSNHLTILRNSLLREERMSERGLKIWVNGASFHIQMLIHGARLDVQTGKPISDHQTAISAAIRLYLTYLDTLLQKLKTALGQGSQMGEGYWNYVFSIHKPISELKTHFSNISNDLVTLINQHDAFILPSRT